MTLRLFQVAFFAFAFLFAAPQNFGFVPNAFAQVLSATGEAENAAIQGIERRADSLKNAFEAAGEDDARLAELRVEADALLVEAQELLDTVETRLNTSRDALTGLGDAPADGATEDVSVSRQREELDGQVQRLQARSVALNSAINTTIEVRDTISELRRDAFARRVLDKTDVDGSLFTEGLNAYRVRLTEVRLLIKNWAVLNVKTEAGAFLGAIAFGFAIAFLVWVVLRRTIAKGLARKRMETEPKLFTKLNIAFWRAISKSLLVAVCLAGMYAMMQWAGLMGPKVSALLRLGGICVTGLAFIWYLSSAVLVPRRPLWRLVPLTNHGAERLRVLIIASAFAYTAVYAGNGIAGILGASVEFSLLTGLIAAIGQGVIIFLMAIGRPVQPKVEPAENALLAAPEDAESDVATAQTAPPPTPAFKLPGCPWPLSLRLVLYAIALAIFGSALLGYIGLASFISRQFVVTGAILTTMYLGYIASREVGREGVFSQTRLGQRTREAMDLDQRGIEQAGLLFGVVGFVAVLGIGLPLIALQWGAQLTDIAGGARRIFTGFEVGSVRISLSGILFGLLTFIGVYFLVRLFQRWLDAGVLARSRVDSGVRDSIRKGVGYAGIALAALIGITSAGINLSSLAIVAGALSLGIGFGLQNIVQNFVSGLILLVERPIKVGDIVTVGGYDGVVSQISVRATQLNLFDQKTVTIPNSEFINGTVNNWTHKNRNARNDIVVGVAYGSDTRLVEQLLLDIAMDHPKVLNEPAPWVLFNDFGGSSLDFQLFIYLANLSDGIATRNEIRHQIVERFDEEGIAIPFPQRDLNLRLVDSGDLGEKLKDATSGERVTIKQGLSDDGQAGEQKETS
ncbi:MAG: mechanosensitive ion channel domain-containing protein [Pseudomonadota bacterium]